MSHFFKLSTIAIIFLTGCNNATESSTSDAPSKPIKELGFEYFQGEWCLVKSTLDGANETPNINFKFNSPKMLAFESKSGSNKFSSGSWSWKPEANVFLLRTPPTLMRIAPVKSAQDNSFMLGKKIGYSFQRGICNN